MIILGGYKTITRGGRGDGWGSLSSSFSSFSFFLHLLLVSSVVLLDTNKDDNDVNVRRLKQ